MFVCYFHMRRMYIRMNSPVMKNIDGTRRIVLSGKIHSRITNNYFERICIVYKYICI